jgi:hypothetical protein
VKTKFKQFDGIGLIARPTGAASLLRLTSATDRLTAWQPLPKVRWMIMNHGLVAWSTTPLLAGRDRRAGERSTGGMRTPSLRQMAATHKDNAWQKQKRMPRRD